MKRKIIKQGHNTLTLTLPSEWTKKLNLNSSDEIDVVENNGSLIINGKQHNSFKSTSIDITGLTMPMIWRYFQGAYREGYDEIKIIYDKNEKEMEGALNFYATHFAYTKLGEKATKKPALETINEIINRFIGVAIIDHGENYCTIREMGEVSAKEFDNSLRRIFLLILELFDELITMIETNTIDNISICKKIHTMDMNVDRFVDYCCRINNKINDSSFQKNKPLMFSTLFLLELLGDEFKYMGTHLSHCKKKINEKQLIDFAKIVKAHFEMYYHIFYKYDKNEVIKFGENDYKIYNEHFELKESSEKDIRGIKRHFMQISKFTFCLMELRIEMEV
ncbi:MAG: AbrB/MazE/SpoVT family DNA-binding domain-containing protein [Candidatus Pacearchaeota archaeon]|nr:AbrB/MazE/SpoVT family DNA-binding domain-containing protein [Candidatus Pacearchaeota archaeon]